MAFAAIGIGGLVPAVIMSIAAVAIVLSAILNAAGSSRGTDQTVPADDHFEPPVAA